MNRYVKVMIIVAAIWVGGVSEVMADGFVPKNSETEWDYTPSPTWATPTCLPCVEEVRICSITIMDDTGVCSDGDGYMDAGEDIVIHVTGSSSDACCLSGGGPSIFIEYSHEGLEYLGVEMISSPGSFSFDYLFSYHVAEWVECMDQVILKVWAVMSSVQDMRIMSQWLEVDRNESGAYECDSTECEGTPELTPTPQFTATSTPLNTATCTPSPVVTPQPTVTPSPLPTRTCAPCMAEINIDQVTILDDIGECSDQDGLMDAGEDVVLKITGYSMDDCCWSGGNRELSVQTDYDGLEYLGTEQISSDGDFFFEYHVKYHVAEWAECLDSANLIVTGRVFDSWSDEDQVEMTCLIEVDRDGQGGYKCDSTACEGTPEPSPSPVNEPSVELMLNSSYYGNGDPFRLQVGLNNNGNIKIDEIILIVVIDVWSEYYWYPSWGTELSYEKIEIDPGLEVQEILNFVWPEVNSTGEGINIFAGLMTADLTTLVGSVDMVTFGWKSE